MILPLLIPPDPVLYKNVTAKRLEKIDLLKKITQNKQVEDFNNK